MSKIWILTNEGCNDGIYNSQVIGHQLYLKSLGIVSEIITYDTWIFSYQRSKSNLKRFKTLNCSISARLFNAPFYYVPFSSLYTCFHFTLLFFLTKDRPSVIHARTEYSLLVTSFVKYLFKVPIIFDVRGDTYSELREGFSNRNKLFKIVLLFYSLKVYVKMFVSYYLADRIIFVSENLRQLYCYRFGQREVTSYIIPCIPSSGVFYFSQSLRNNGRSKFGFKGERVILYSGSVSEYQNLSNSLELLEYLLTKDYTLLVVTRDVHKVNEEINKLHLPSNKVTIYSAEYSEMNMIYNCADFGLLFRNISITNFVSSPTKFYEYSLTGLPVIMNESCPQVYRAAKEFNNYLNFELIEKYEIDEKLRNEVSLKYLESFTKESFTNIYSLLYAH
jgi:hypothetical protein